ncbi:MAG: hypothetical protein A2V74_05280 [Acidobacteria bacterium RBG_16_70_10]|nr:MAG: hypothetical protein A2V74_05280 [Acidobacteria bacterium RBG_16_70_10]
MLSHAHGARRKNQRAAKSAREGPSSSSSSLRRSRQATARATSASGTKTPKFSSRETIGPPGPESHPGCQPMREATPKPPVTSHTEKAAGARAQRSGPDARRTAPAPTAQTAITTETRRNVWRWIIGRAPQSSPATHFGRPRPRRSSLSRSLQSTSRPAGRPRRRPRCGTKRARKRFFQASVAW